MKLISFPLRILKDEYTRTNFKSVNKSRFPYLLNQLFETKAIKNKNNIVKSFMRAGVFPLNPKSIDHSRILQNNEFFADSSTTTNTTHNNSANNSSIPVNFVSSNNNYDDADTSSSNLNTFYSFNNATSSFASSQEAIFTLDRVLQESIILNNNDDESDDNSDEDDNDDDKDYVPTRSISTSSKTVASIRKPTPKSKTLLKRKNHRLTSSRESNKGKKVTLDLSNFDFIDQDGNFCLIP